MVGLLWTSDGGYASLRTITRRRNARGIDEVQTTREEREKAEVGLFEAKVRIG